MTSKGQSFLRRLPDLFDGFPVALLVDAPER